MSRVVVFDEFGGPQVLHLIDEPPVDPAAGEVRVAIEATAVNPLDAMMRSGTSPGRVLLPGARLGIEATGVIDALGTGVTGFDVGDPVIVTAIPDAVARGSYADYTTIAATNVTARPVELDVPQAAAVWVAYATAYGSLVELAQMQPTDTVLISGASGAVGRMAMQIANVIGATPIAITRSSDKTDELLAAGAAHVVATDRESVAEAVGDVTDGAGVDIVLDLVRGPGQADLLNATRAHGKLIAAGFLDPRPASDPGETPVTLLTYRGWDHLLDADKIARTTAFFAAGVRLGALRPAIDSIYTLDQVVDAHRRFDQGLNRGRKIVIANAELT